jgi:TonB family protein
LNSPFRVTLAAAACLALAAASLSAQPPVTEAPAELPSAAPVEPPSAAPVEPPAQTEAAVPASDPAPPDWFETRLEIEALAESGDYAAALALRDRLFEFTAEQFGPTSGGVAQAHLLIADVHRRSGDFRAAEEEILAALDLFEDINGPLSPALIEPFLDLGDNYSESGDHASALIAWAEARNIGRRNFGLLNTDQLPIIDDMTDAAEELGQIEEARDLQLEALALVERNHPEFAPETIEAHYKFAAWLREHNFYEDERRIYYQIERIVNQHYEGDPLMLVRALRTRAASYRQADNGDGLGLSALRNAKDLLENMDQPPILLLAEVNLDIGDWYVEFSRTGAIGAEYLDAWELLGQLDNGEELRREWFEELNEVEMSSLSRRGLSTDTDDPEGYVVVYFTVSPSGRTRDIEVTDSRPQGFKDSAVTRLMRDARFRPMVTDGELVSMRRAYRFEFRYEPDEVD